MSWIRLFQREEGKFKERSHTLLETACTFSLNFEQGLFYDEVHTYQEYDLSFGEASFMLVFLLELHSLTKVNPNQHPSLNEALNHHIRIFKKFYDPST